MSEFDVAFDVEMSALQATAADVLSQHGVTVDDGNLFRIALYLASASDGGTRADTWRFLAREQAERLERIATLDTLIAGYRKRLALLAAMIAESPMCGDPDVVSHEALYLHRDHGRDLREIVKDLECLREAEDTVAADWKPPPRARPTSAKNEYASQIYFYVLDDLELKRSQKCLVIADLLIAAGIDDRPREKVQASLVEVIRNKAVRLK